MSWTNFKLKINKLDFTTNLKPFGWLGNFLGIFQGKFVNDRLKSCNRINRCYVFILFGVRVYFRISSFPKIVFPPPLLTKIMILSTHGSLCAVEIANFVTTAFLDKRFISFFDKLAIYDERVAKLEHSRRDETRTYWICLGLSIALAIWIMRSYAENPSATWTSVVAEDSIFLIQGFTCLLGILKFNLLVNLTCQRFRHLNKTILPSVAWTRQLAGAKCLVSVTSYDVVLLHSTLTDASAIITDVYSIPLLCWFSNFLFTAVLYAYNATYLTWHAAVPFCTILIAEILITCTVCNTTAEEANNTGKYMSEDKPTLIEDSTAMDRVRMQLYLLNNRVVFSAGDFFEIRLSLLYSMFVSIATYGVLLTSYRKKHSATT